MVSVSVSLRKSKQLTSVSNELFEMTPEFRSRTILNRLATRIMDTKKISWEGERVNRTIVANIYKCLDTFNFVNSVFHRIETLRSTTFAYDTTEHVELLEKFWSLLKPGIMRTPYVPKVTAATTATAGVHSKRMSVDWSEVGFQSMDPSTDFRAMGLLGLVQLHYFSLHRPNDANDVLKESNHVRRFYPFAATGINVSFFVSELMRERRLDAMMIRHLFNRGDRTYSRQSSSSSAYDTVGIANTWSDSPGTADESTERTYLLSAYQVRSPSIEYSWSTFSLETTEEPFPTDLLVKGESCIHDLYCDIYTDFNALWRERDPPDIMSFQSIFDEIKLRWRRKLPALGH